MRNGPSAPKRLEHKLQVTCVEFSPDGSRLATGSADATARIWDPVTARQVGPALRHDSGVLGIAFHPDGRRIATCSDDNTARLWDIATGEPLTAQLKHGGNVPCVAIGPRGRFILTASNDGTAQLWDVGPPRDAPSIEKRPLAKGSPPAATHVWWSSDRSHCVVAEGSQSARIRDAGGKDEGRLLHHGGPVTFAAFSPDGTRVVTTSEDCTCRLWDVATGELLVPPLKHLGSVYSAAFSPDSRSYVITASADGTGRVWDAGSGEPVTAALPFSGKLLGVAFPEEDRVQVISIHGEEEWIASWPLVSTDLPAGALLAEAEVLSHCRIDSDRGLMPLDIQTLRRRGAKRARLVRRGSSEMLAQPPPARARRYGHRQPNSPETVSPIGTHSR